MMMDISEKQIDKYTKHMIDDITIKMRVHKRELPDKEELAIQNICFKEIDKYIDDYGLSNNPMLIFKDKEHLLEVSKRITQIKGNLKDLGFPGDISSMIIDAKNIIYCIEHGIIAMIVLHYYVTKGHELNASDMKDIVKDLIGLLSSK
jgi:hypothetical protein